MGLPPLITTKREEKSQQKQLYIENVSRTFLLNERFFKFCSALQFFKFHTHDFTRSRNNPFLKSPPLFSLPSG